MFRCSLCFPLHTCLHYWFHWNTFSGEWKLSPHSSCAWASTCSIKGKTQEKHFWLFVRCCWDLFNIKCCLSQIQTKPKLTSVISFVKNIHLCALSIKYSQDQNWAHWPLLPAVMHTWGIWLFLGQMLFWTSQKFP